MKVRQFIRPDITVSAIAHLSVLALVILFTEVHKFASVTAEPIAVDLVTSDELAKQPDPLPMPTPQPSPDLSQLTQLPAPAEPTQPVSPPPQQQQPPAANRREAAAQPKPKATAQAQAAPQAAPPPQAASQPPPAPPPSPGYTPPEPDVTVKYHVMLGLPEDVSPSAGKPDDFDATASTAADISSTAVAMFRRHLKSCSKLPASVAPTDHLMVKLRVILTPEGRLASRPLVGGGSAEVKALDLVQSAIDALEACQPYTMLPKDRYGEWKVLDLTLTPQDFSGA